MGECKEEHEAGESKRERHERVHEGPVKPADDPGQDGGDNPPTIPPDTGN